MTETPEPDSGRQRVWRVGRLTADGQHEVWRTVWTYCTSIFGDGTPPEYRGSGTFVNVRGAPCLLTAAHVWERMARDSSVGFVLENDRPPAWLPRATIEPRYVSVRGSDEWGPDIAILSLAARDVTRLQSQKAFYLVERPRPLSVDPRASLIWVLTGASAELSEFDAEEGRLKNHLVGSTEPNHVTHDGLDYVEVSYGSTPVEDIPMSWGGLSGAGLWLCQLVPGATQAELNVVPLLMGVAFYQRITGERRGFIRCHGPRSLRSSGLDHVA